MTFLRHPASRKDQSWHPNCSVSAWYPRQSRPGSLKPRCTFSQKVLPTTNGPPAVMPTPPWEITLCPAWSPPGPPSCQRKKPWSLSRLWNIPLWSWCRAWAHPRLSGPQACWASSSTWPCSGSCSTASLPSCSADENVTLGRAESSSAALGDCIYFCFLICVFFHSIRQGN